MNIVSIERDLDYAITRVLETLPIPNEKGNSVRFRNFVIRKNRNNKYYIFDCTNQDLVAITNFKISALAIVKSFIGNARHKIKTIKDIDLALLRHYNDLFYFNYYIKNTKNKVLRDTMTTRLEVAMDDCELTKNQLLKMMHEMDKNTRIKTYNNSRNRFV